MRWGRRKAAQRSISSKRKGSVGLLWRAGRSWWQQRTQKVQSTEWCLQAVPLIGGPAFWNLRPLTQEQVWSKEDLPLVEENQVRAPLSKCATMGPDGRHAWVLRVLADVTARPLWIVFETSWGLGEVPWEWKKADVTPTFEKGRRMIQGRWSKEDDPGNWSVSFWTLGRLQSN